MANHVNVGNIKIGNDLPLVLIAGPCQMESRDHAMKMAEHVKKICDRLNMQFIFKTSFDKANRSSLNGKRGIGLENALPVFEEIKKTFNCPVLTDVHTEEQCKIAAEIIDVLQIPAFLCRQTDLLLAAGNTGKVVNVKKGQFLAPWDIKNIIEKVYSTGNKNVLITERGTSFGYNTLISDMRALPIMARFGAPIVFDATHSVQQPGGKGSESGGEREFVEVLARAAIAVGVAAVFMEVHNDPDNAPSDGPCMLKVDNLENLLSLLKKFDTIVKS
ncbi:MAG: 3-deoxy-8-phosphooctulonate synthase [Sphingobacteriia bacterium]|nr:3-deoxy-8-phosphooctulonate synthase [Sphingobacteriia bacterium]